MQIDTELATPNTRRFHRLHVNRVTVDFPLCHCFFFLFLDFRIFQISPDALSYFSNPNVESDEFQAHITLVMSTLDKAVQSLDDLTKLLPSLKRLGTIHANMGIKKEQFAVSIAGAPPRQTFPKSLILKGV